MSGFVVPRRGRERPENRARAFSHSLGRTESFDAGRLLSTLLRHSGCSKAVSQDLRSGHS